MARLEVPVTVTVATAAPTQVAYPWRSTLRTLFAAVVALASLAPTILTTTGLDGWVYAGQVAAVAAAITRVMALPGVNDFINRFLPWLAPEPKAPKADAAAIIDRSLGK